jgi:hypothetical protein
MPLYRLAKRYRDYNLKGVRILYDRDPDFSLDGFNGEKWVSTGRRPDSPDVVKSCRLEAALAGVPI